nr:MAG TPA: hypothetical protein [Caudoviricetes sp.]
MENLRLLANHNNPGNKRLVNSSQGVFFMLKIV